MSGTSMDGVDGVVVDMNPGARCRVLAHQHQPFSAGLRQSLLDLNHSGHDEIHRAALASNALAHAYSDVVTSLLLALQLAREEIRAVGAHGQTVRHRPGEFDTTGYTCQLMSGALLAELSGMDVICDFRSRDVAAGGQGAPLVPAFHRAIFSQPGLDIAVLNLGGIANITLLYADGRTSGHDTGPGNVLMDVWCRQHTGQTYDHEGRWAASGQPSESLLSQWLREPYFSRSPPKSTGRDLFDTKWLQTHCQVEHASKQGMAPADVQATLCLLTAKTVAAEVRAFMPEAHRLLVCGGGAYNKHLIATIRNELQTVDVLTIDQVSSMHPMHVEAAAFAWLASAFIERHAGNCVAVTGARGQRILGSLYPA